jgi:hypothetical protein
VPAAAAQPHSEHRRPNDSRYAHMGQTFRASLRRATQSRRNLWIATGQDAAASQNPNVAERPSHSGRAGSAGISSSSAAATLALDIAIPPTTRSVSKSTLQANARHGQPDAQISKECGIGSCGTRCLSSGGNTSSGFEFGTIVVMPTMLRLD